VVHRCIFPRHAIEIGDHSSREVAAKGHRIHAVAHENTYDSALNTGVHRGVMVDHSHGGQRNIDSFVSSSPG
jgi:hypothetical protein